MQSSTAGSAAAQASPQQLNLGARQLCIQNAIDMWLPIASGQIATGPGSVTNIPCRNVGLVKRFLIKLSLPVTAFAGEAATLGPFGPGSALSNVTLTDLSNQLRVNTSGVHLHLLSTVKRRRAYGAAFVSDTPFGYGNNMPAVMSAPATINGGATGYVDCFFEVPVSYSDHDLRGAIMAAVTNATFNLAFTLNPNMFGNSGTTDATGCLYISAGADDPTLGTVVYTIYQNFLDQLPRDPKSGQYILPLLDIGTAYMIANTPQGGIVANQPNPFQYPNWRDIMSTMLIFDNAGSLNPGTDISFFALESANFTNVFRLDPFTSALMTRSIIGDDPPPGMYYFDHRAKPINTIQFGNMNLIVQPSLVTTGASFQFGLEMLAIIGQITQAGSLA